MVSVVFIEHNGVKHEVNAPDGWSLMEAAVKNGVPGIDGDCGGVCACATCHIFVEPDWANRLEKRSSVEAEMLEYSTEAAQNSRLACQITVNSSLDGLTVRMPASQQ